MWILCIYAHSELKFSKLDILMVSMKLTGKMLTTGIKKNNLLVWILIFFYWVVNSLFIESSSLASVQIFCWCDGNLLYLLKREAPLSFSLGVVWRVIWVTLCLHLDLFISSVSGADETSLPALVADRNSSPTEAVTATP